MVECNVRCCGPLGNCCKVCVHTRCSCRCIHCTTVTATLHVPATVALLVTVTVSLVPALCRVLNTWHIHCNNMLRWPVCADDCTVYTTYLCFSSPEQVLDYRGSNLATCDHLTFCSRVLKFSVDAAKVYFSSRCSNCSWRTSQQFKSDVHWTEIKNWILIVMNLIHV